MAKASMAVKARAAPPRKTFPGFVCQSCESPIALAGDRNALPKTFKVICPKCGEIATYRKSEMKPMQWRRGYRFAAAGPDGF